MNARPDSGRQLTEADVDAIVAGLEERLEERFYQNLGKGLWGVVWKVAMGLLLLLAAYGVGSSQHAEIMQKGIGQ